MKRYTNDSFILFSVMVKPVSSLYKDELNTARLDKMIIVETSIGVQNLIIPTNPFPFSYGDSRQGNFFFLSSSSSYCF